MVTGEKTVEISGYWGENNEDFMETAEEKMGILWQLGKNQLRLGGNWGGTMLISGNWEGNNRDFMATEDFISTDDFMSTWEETMGISGN